MSENSCIEILLCNVPHDFPQEFISMVQNKSGMTSDSLVDIAELIPDAVKYEVSAWINENIVILNEIENNLNAAAILGLINAVAMWTPPFGPTIPICYINILSLP